MAQCDGVMARCDGVMARCDGAMARCDAAIARCDAAIWRDANERWRNICDGAILLEGYRCCVRNFNSIYFYTCVIGPQRTNRGQVNVTL